MTAVRDALRPSGLPCTTSVTGIAALGAPPDDSQGAGEADS
jgi:hypothetical protein